MLSLVAAGRFYGTSTDVCISRGFYTAVMYHAIRLVPTRFKIVSTVTKPTGVVKEILEGITSWMEKKNYRLLRISVSFSRKNLNDPFVYQRAQYVDILTKSETIFKKYPMV